MRLKITLLSLATFIFTFTTNTLKYLTLHIFAFDFGIFYQAAYYFHKTGVFFNFYEADVHGVISHLQVHFQPVIAIYSLVFYVTDNPLALFLFNDAFAALSVYTLYKAVIVLTNDRKKAETAALYYVVFPFAIGSLSFSFHPISLAMAAAPLAAAYAMKRDWKNFSMVVPVILLTKEDSIVFLVALIAALVVDSLVVKKKTISATIKEMASLLAVTVGYGVLLLAWMHYVNYIYTSFTFIYTPDAIRRLAFFTIVLLSTTAFFVLMDSRVLSYTAVYLVFFASNPVRIITLPGFQYFYLFAPALVVLLAACTGFFEDKKLFKVAFVVSVLLNPYVMMINVDKSYSMPASNNPALLFILYMKYKDGFDFAREFAYENAGKMAFDNKLAPYALGRGWIPKRTGADTLAVFQKGAIASQADWGGEVNPVSFNEGATVYVIEVVPGGRVDVYPHDANVTFITIACYSAGGEKCNK